VPSPAGGGLSGSLFPPDVFEDQAFFGLAPFAFCANVGDAREVLSLLKLITPSFFPRGFPAPVAPLAVSDRSEIAFISYVVVFFSPSSFEKPSFGPLIPV